MSLATSTDRHEKKELQEKVLPRILATNAIQKAIREVIGSTAIWDGTVLNNLLLLDSHRFELTIVPRCIHHILEG
jgi:hypothetical protein